jgi:hypothetical protein
MTNGYLKMVIGSYGSYAACNERALGTEIDRADFETWSDVLDELTNRGFDLDGIDEELMLLDVDSDILPYDTATSENMSEMFDAYKELETSGTNFDPDIFWRLCEELSGDIYDVMRAYRDGILWAGCDDMSDVARRYIDEFYPEIDNLPSFISCHLDYEGIGRDLEIEGHFISTPAGMFEIID